MGVLRFTFQTLGKIKVGTTSIGNIRGAGRAKIPKTRIAPQKLGKCPHPRQRSNYVFGTRGSILFWAL